MEDQNGNAVSGVAVNFTAPTSGATATLTTAAATEVNGETSVTATAGTVAGTYTVIATASGVGSVTFTLTNTADVAATIVAISGTPQSAPVGVAFGLPLLVEVEDQYGNAVSGATVTYAAPSSDPTASLTTPALTGANGETSVVATAGMVDGTYTVTATVGAVGPANFALTNVAGSGAKLTVVSGNDQSATVGTAFAAPIVVEVDDAFGNPVAGADVTFTAPGSDPTASLSTPAVTGANGQTSVTATAGMVAGAYSVTVTAPGANTATVALNNTTGLGTIVIAAGNNQSAVVGESFSLALVVRVADQFGNGVSGVAVNYTAPGSGATASLGTAAVTDADGETSATALAGTVAGSYTVTATASGIGR